MSKQQLEISVPKFNNMNKENLPDRLLMGPGPSNISAEVREALTFPYYAPFDEETMMAMQDIREGIKYLFQTKSRLTFAFSGAAMAAMECAITNLVQPGEVFLVMNRGIWDSRAADIGRRHGAVVKEVSIPAGTTFTLEQIEDALKTHRPVVLFIVHGDSSTGTLQQVEGVGELCHKYNALSIVDTVVSIGCVPFMMDAWKIDAVYAGAQKGLSAVACISPISFNARAEKKIFSQGKSRVWYYDLEQLANQWNCFADTRHYHHTSSSPLLFALRASLVGVAEEGLHNAWKRHKEAAEHLYKGLEKLDLEYLVHKSSDRLITVTPLVYPQGYNYADVGRFLRNKWGIVTNPGLGPTAGKCLRVGTMGDNARKENVDKLLQALKQSLIELTKSKC